MIDWNNNGERDFQDEMIDFAIFQELQRQEKGNYSSGSGDGFLTFLGVGLLVFGILMILGMIF